MSDEHREQAREIIGNVNNYAEESTGELSISAFGPLATRIAEALSSRDAEVREVLEGVLEFCDQVIEAFEIRPLPAHRITLQRARDLYTKLQPKEVG